MKCYFNLEAQELRINEKLHDDVEISFDEHQNILNALNSGCIILPDLTPTPPRPTAHHNWDGGNWIDSRTPEQIVEYERSLLPPFTKRQFSLYLYDIGKYEEVMDALNANPRFKIEFETVATIERNSPTVTAMGQILGWDDLIIDDHWKKALKL